VLNLKLASHYEEPKFKPAVLEEAKVINLSSSVKPIQKNMTFNIPVELRKHSSQIKNASLIRLMPVS
jgi:hypothetical protein